ncbi:hypothetical protein [Caminicella sporogenes]|uniref:hypothetical protein n=1 Tax=Caminicella sporogenes TaxID=166485 RepID=UPI002540A690|nr:hypothetical protein [Caminicella sporogenes]WIF95031.1 hypothetical protein QNI18_12335 [Caminicella sporogenes]
MDYGKFSSLQELKDSIEMGLDIECYIYGQRYYIGWGDNGRVIAKCPDGDGVYFNSLDEMLNFKIQDKKMKDIWKDIQIISM